MNDNVFEDIIARLDSQNIYISFINNHYYVMAANSGSEGVYVMKDVSRYIIRPENYIAAFLMFNCVYNLSDILNKPQLVDKVFDGGIKHNSVLKVMLFPSNSMLLYNIFKYSEKAVEFSSYMLEEILYE